MYSTCLPSLVHLALLVLLILLAPLVRLVHLVHLIRLTRRTKVTKMTKMTSSEMRENLFFQRYLQGKTPVQDVSFLCFPLHNPLPSSLFPFLLPPSKRPPPHSPPPPKILSCLEKKVNPPMIDHARRHQIQNSDMLSTPPRALAPHMPTSPHMPTRQPRQRPWMPWPDFLLLAFACAGTDAFRSRWLWWL